MKISYYKTLLLLNILIVLFIFVMSFQLGRNLNGPGLWLPSTIALVILVLFTLFILLTWKIIHMKPGTEETDDIKINKEGRKKNRFNVHRGIGFLYTVAGFGLVTFYSLLMITALGNFDKRSFGVPPDKDLKVLIEKGLLLDYNISADVTVEDWSFNATDFNNTEWVIHIPFTSEETNITMINVFLDNEKRDKPAGYTFE